MMLPFLLFATVFIQILQAYEWAPTQCGPTNQITQWGKTVNPSSVLPAYPRPQMVRGNDNSWMNLNGLWNFNGTTNNIEEPLGYYNGPFATQILVPFPVESCLSGIGQTYKHLSYQTTFNDFTNRDKTSTKILLQFGAIDWQSSIYLNGKLIGNHTGGYDSFTFDITNDIITSNNQLMVSVYDPSDEGYQPNGKQRISAITKPGGDTYTPSSGIWQTVWIEMVEDPKMYISSYKLYPTLSSVSVNVSVTGTSSTPITLTVMDPDTNKMVTSKQGTSGQLINIDIPSNSIKLWDPLNNSPFLYDLNISIDNSKESVLGYFGLRTISLGQYNHSKAGTGPQVGIDRPGDDLPGYPIKLNSSNYNICWGLCNTTSNCEAWAYAVPGCDSYQDPMCWLKGSIPGTSENKCRVSGAEGISEGPAVRPLLNGQPLFLAGWLDQSFWPDGLYTAPTDDALKFDLQSILDYGLNGVRLHQKVNPERWYYWADKLGIIIMQDMIQKYGGASNATIAPFMSDLTAMIEGKFNHPSIIQWETFNEGDCWGVFHNPSVADVVKYAQSLDSTRLVDTDSGGGANNQHIGDVNDIHTYPFPGDPQPYKDYQYAMLGEYGGIGCFITGKEWVKNGCFGYKTVPNPYDYASIYVNMSEMILANSGDISAVIYTQLSDIEEECDGYFNYDRSDKWNDSEKQMVKTANQNMINNMWKQMK